MIIRSQDKRRATTDLNLHIESIKVGTENIKRVFIKSEKMGTIGTYSTEEKALKVLDMIQATYERNKLFAITYKDGVLQRLEKCNGLEGTRELIGSVFQMPSDESVEV